MPKLDSRLRAQGYADAMRLDFAVAPAYDAVVFAAQDMAIVTLDQPPTPELLREFEDLRRKVGNESDRGGPAEHQAFDLNQRSFFVYIRKTYKAGDVAEAIASDLETRYGMTVLRKQSQPDGWKKKHSPKAVKQFSRLDAFAAGYAAVMSDRPLRTRDFAAGYAAVMAS